MIQVGGTVIRLCSNIPLSTFFLMKRFTSSLIGLDVLGSLNHRDFDESNWHDLRFFDE